MLYFFKKKRKIPGGNWKKIDLLLAISRELPSKYTFIQNQLEDRIIIDSVPNEFLGHGWKRTICDQKLYEKYKNNSVNYKLIGIKILNSANHKYEPFEFDIYEGIIIGYRITDEKVEYDTQKIDINDLREVEFINQDKVELLKIIGEVKGSDYTLLDIDDTIKIEIPEGIFYTVKDFGNGDYLAVSNSGEIYGLIHDPYQIEKLFESYSSFLKALDKGEFDTIAYYESKMK